MLLLLVPIGALWLDQGNGCNRGGVRQGCVLSPGVGWDSLIYCSPVIGVACCTDLVSLVFAAIIKNDLVFVCFVVDLILC